MLVYELKAHETMDRMEQLNQVSTSNASKCPNCGVDNKCAMEAGKSASACWCMGVPVTGELSGDQCLCRSCLSKAKSAT